LKRLRCPSGPTSEALRFSVSWVQITGAIRAAMPLDSNVRAYW
jgi:hypothetical protein